MCGLPGQGMVVPCFPQIKTIQDLLCREEGSLVAYPRLRFNASYPLSYSASKNNKTENAGAKQN